MRKWERRLFLSADYVVEAFYCELIELATHVTYGVAGSDTYAWIENARDSVFAANPRVRRVRAVGRDSYLVIVPRYQEFTPTALRLAQRGVRFADVAGNSEILVSALAPRAFSDDLAEGKAVFSADILTQPHRKRLLLAVPVQALHRLLAALQQRGLEVEHIYDY